MRIAYILFSAFFILSGCSDGYQLKGFDKIAWKQDRKGCLGKRSELAKLLLSHKTEFKGMDDDDLVSLLGTPERTVYYGRGRKDYAYYISAGGQCAETPKMKAGSRILVEFDALGYVNIITLQDI